MKDVVGYEGLYAVTSCGKVYSYKRKKFLKPKKEKSGYLRVALSKDGQKKWFFLHRLVAEAYIPNPDNLETVNHIDENKEHNYINNLCWMTHRDNKTYSAGKPVRCVETGQIFDSTREAARQLDLHQSSISAICRGERKTTGGYHFEFI